MSLGTSSVPHFIPTIWSASVLRSFEKANVFANVLSREYSGEITDSGDTVKIPIVTKPGIRAYEKNTDISYDLVSGNTLTVTVDQCNYFALKADDLDALQSKPAFLDAATRSAGLELADLLDKNIAETLIDDAGIDLTSSPLPIGDQNVLTYLAEIAEKMDDNNVPRGKRWLVAPPSLANKISLAVINKGIPNTEAIADGFIARVLGFDVYMSNNIPKTAGGASQALAGVMEAASLIAEVSKLETLRDPARFGDLVRGYLLWKAAVLLPEGIVKVAYA